jgi:hypothetical protein
MAAGFEGLRAHRAAPNGPIVMLQAGEGTVGITVHAKEGSGTFGGSWWMNAVEVPEFCRLLEEVAAVALDSEKALQDKENGEPDGR